MKLIDRLKIAVSNQKWDSMLQSFLNGDDYTPNNAGVNVSGNAALKYSAVFACCRVLAETFATIPVFEYQKKADGDREKTDNTGLYDILHTSMNSEMSAFNAKEMAMYQINLGGNVVFTKEQNRFGEIIGLYPHEWQNVGIDRNENNGLLEYTFSDRVQSYTLGRSDIFTVPGPSLNGFWGMSTIEYFSSAIALGKQYEKFSNNFYKNGVFSTGVFEHPTFLKPEAYTRIKKDLSDNYSGLMNTGKPLLLEDGMKFSPMQIKLIDAELLASKKFQIEDICRAFRVPLHLVQSLDKATNNNIEHQSLEFIMYTMLPWVKRWEDNINTQLLTKKQRSAGYYFEFNLQSLLRGDSKSMAEAFAIGRQWGWLSVNDVRRLLNMNAIPNGDIYLTPLNMGEAGKESMEKSPSNDDLKKEIDNMYKIIELSKAGL